MNVFQRLGPWMHDHRRWVLAFWVVGTVRLQRHRRRGRRRLPRRVQPARRRVQARASTSSTRASSGAGRRPVRHHRVPGRAGGRRPRGPGGDGGALRRGRRARRGRPRRQPVRRGGRRARSRRRAPTPGKIAYANIELPDDIDFSRRPSEMRDDILEETPDDRRPADRAGRVHLRRVRDAVVRGARPGVRHRDPDPGLRVGAGHGPADRRRPVRHRHRHRASSRCSATSCRSPSSPRSSA